jgi:acetate kinase
LRLLRIDLEEERNTANSGVNSTVASRVVVRVIPKDEERMIAKTVCCVPGLAGKRRIES